MPSVPRRVCSILRWQLMQVMPPICSVLCKVLDSIAAPNKSHGFAQQMSLSNTPRLHDRSFLQKNPINFSLFYIFGSDGPLPEPLCHARRRLLVSFGFSAGRGNSRLCFAEKSDMMEKRPGFGPGGWDADEGQTKDQMGLPVG